MSGLTELLAGRDDSLQLDRAALELAAIEFPGLESGPFLELLDSYAVELADRLSGECDGAAYVRTANQYLFSELGFSGNSRDYYDPLNSCLNEVLTARVGIPITLSLVYMEIGRRLAKPIFGIGLPGHFIVRYNDGDFATFLDPFHAGRLLHPSECYQIAREMSGVLIQEDPALLQPITKRQMLLRMLHNLRGIYFARNSLKKALRVLDLLIAANPKTAADEYKQRGLVYLTLGQTSRAAADLVRYLKCQPEAEDRAEIEKQLSALQRWKAEMN